MTIKAGDWVKCPGHHMIGFARRVAKDGSWVDVDWGTWTKRQPAQHLEVVTTIPFRGGTVTDLTRKAELQS